MSLSARLIALQGFQLTPIALAIQGLIDQILKEKQEQVYGKGRGRPQPRRKQAGLTREEVERSWDLLETRLRNQEKQTHSAPAHVPEKPQPVIASSDKRVFSVVMEVPTVAAPDLAEQTRLLLLEQNARRQADDEALMVLLSEI